MMQSIQVESCRSAGGTVKQQRSRLTLLSNSLLEQVRLLKV